MTVLLCSTLCYCTAHHLCSITVLHTHHCTNYCTKHYTAVLITVLNTALITVLVIPHSITVLITIIITVRITVPCILSSASGHYSSFCSSLQHCTHEPSTNQHTDHTHIHTRTPYASHSLYSAGGRTVHSGSE
jgi:hypothetical protein